MTDNDRVEGEELPNIGDLEACRAYFKRRREAGITHDLSKDGHKFGPSTYNVLGYASEEEKAEMDAALRFAQRCRERNKDKSE